MSTWVIISRDDCSYCELAISALEDRGFTPRVFKISSHGELKDFIVSLGLRSVPQIWHHGVHIGGWEGLRPIIAGIPFAPDIDPA